MGIVLRVGPFDKDDPTLPQNVQQFGIAMPWQSASV